MASETESGDGVLQRIDNWRLKRGTGPIVKTWVYLTLFTALTLLLGVMLYFSP